MDRLEKLRRWIATMLRFTPVALSFALLSGQVAIPWIPSHLVTQDGPSHLYGGVILRGLLFNHAHSIYSAWYTIQRTPLPNWTASIVLALADTMGGAGNAEPIFMSLAILTGFIAIAYTIRALSPGTLPFHPLSNFLLQTWFLWVGFYNFYLGMALMPFAIGYYARRRGELSWKGAAGLSGIILVVFTTHLIAGFIAVMAVLIMAVWTTLLGSELRAGGGRLLKVAVAVVPVCALALWYSLGEHEATRFASGAKFAWNAFPMQVFVTASGPDGFQGMPRKVLLGFAILAVALLRKAEWRSPRGGLALAAMAAFLLYIFLPDNGLGGGYVKIRFSYAVFLLAGIAAVNTYRLWWANVPLAAYFAFVLAHNFVATERALEQISGAAAEYLSVACRIPPSTTFVRFRYATPDAPDHFLYRDAGRDPLEHLDAFVAASHLSLDLSDYEALSRNFPIVNRKSVDPGQQSGLGAFEGPDAGAIETLKWLNKGLPKPIEYEIVVGDLSAPDVKRQGMQAMMNYLDSSQELVASSKEGWFRLYRSRESRPALAPSEALCR